ncbi:hypothetical protein C2845_PM16G19930 [Panicum miliaceum]|uniref:Uncharacterized protein n=1 Tax=Panicum miliaceum TaxID=4540 RepID=A0A3L6PZ66_PANMI|nr:hypothetical protein C2845_PM16G19930 [Panicum miliaceum]
MELLGLSPPPPDGDGSTGGCDGSGADGSPAGQGRRRSRPQGRLANGYGATAATKARCRRSPEIPSSHHLDGLGRFGFLGTCSENTREKINAVVVAVPWTVVWLCGLWCGVL